jgi:hypothetical protein
VNFCAWHAYQVFRIGYVKYTNLPYVSDNPSCGSYFINSGSIGKLDGFAILAAHEYAETLTDAYPNAGWLNRTGSAFNGQEVSDECQWRSSGQGATKNYAFATGTFPLPGNWSNLTNQCE